MKHKVQFITHQNSKYSYYDSAKIALESGIRWIQLRMKNRDHREVVEEAIRIHKLCRDYGATFVINDNPVIAKEVGADGVHLGKNDMSISEARKLVPNIIIGGTANTMDDIRLLHNQKVDYIGLGPFRETKTKDNLSPVLGVNGYKNIIEQCTHERIDTPIYAIGGIRVDDIATLKELGIFGIALSSVILQSETPIQTGKTIVESYI